MHSKLRNSRQDALEGSCEGTKRELRSLTALGLARLGVGLWPQEAVAAGESSWGAEKVKDRVLEELR